MCFLQKHSVIRYQEVPKWLAFWEAKGKQSIKSRESEYGVAERPEVWADKAALKELSQQELRV